RPRVFEGRSSCSRRAREPNRARSILPSSGRSAAWYSVGSSVTPTPHFAARLPERAASLDGPRRVGAASSASLGGRPALAYAPHCSTANVSFDGWAQHLRGVVRLPPPKFNTSSLP